MAEKGKLLVDAFESAILRRIVVSGLFLTYLFMSECREGSSRSFIQVRLVSTSVSPAVYFVAVRTGIVRCKAYGEHCDRDVGEACHVSGPLSF